jgi:hypothetical protein
MGRGADQVYMDVSKANLNLYKLSGRNGDNIAHVPYFLHYDREA